MRSLYFLLCVLLTLLFMSCVKDSEEAIFDNPLDEGGTNWHAPIIDEMYISDSLVPINDTLWITIKADPEVQHDAMDSGFIRDMQSYETWGRPFEGGYAILPILKSDSGTFNFEYWISDKVGRRNDRVTDSFSVGLYPPEINPNNNWSTPSGQELTINMELFAGDENGNIISYSYRTDPLQDWIEQSESEILPSWTISEAGGGNYNRTLYLRVMDDDSLVTEEEVSVQVTKVQPELKSFNVPSTVSKDVEIHIGASFTDQDNAVEKYLWAIGHNAPNVNFDKETDAGGFDTTFTEGGTYFIKVKAVDQGGVESGVQTKEIVVNESNTNVVLAAVSDINPSVAAGTEIIFEVSATPNDVVSNYSWTLLEGEEVIGSENTTEGKFPWTFNEPGNFKVGVKANGVESNVVEFNVEITGNEVKPSLEFVSPNEPFVTKYRDQTLDITINANNMDGGIRTIYWLINGDEQHTSTETSHSIKLSNLAESITTFKLSVVGEDQSGNKSDTISFVVNIDPGKPILQSVYRVLAVTSTIPQGGTITVKSGLKIFLRASAKDVNTFGNITQIEWAIKKSTETKWIFAKEEYDPTKNFETFRNEPGKYDAAVRAIDNDGEMSDPYTFTIIVE